MSGVLYQPLLLGLRQCKPVQHRGERPGQPAHLVLASAGHLDVQLAGVADQLGRGRQSDQALGDLLGQEPAEDGGDHGQAHRADRENDGQSVQD